MIDLTTLLLGHHLGIVIHLFLENVVVPVLARRKLPLRLILLILVHLLRREIRHHARLDVVLDIVLNFR